ncbi:unnamed protein product, partial [Ectocarpus fasciculatus]
IGPGGAHGAGAGMQGTAIETQQYELQMRMVEILMESLQYTRALRLLNNLLRRKIKSGQRSLVLVLVARCYLKLRKVAACEAALERVVLEADEALATYGQMGRTSSDQASHRRTASGGGNEYRLNSTVLAANSTPMPGGGLAWTAGGGSGVPVESTAGDKPSVAGGMSGAGGGGG